MAGVVLEPPAKRLKLESCDIIDRSSTSSDDSWRGYETAWVKDSGDDWSPSTSHGSDAESDGDATDLIYKGEYDIASSDSDNTNARIDSGSDTDDVKVYIVPIIANTYEPEEESSASNNTSTDGDDGLMNPIPVTRKISVPWKCLACGIRSYPPMRYCYKCYKNRREERGPRPKLSKGKTTRESSCRNASGNESVMDATPSTSSSTSSSVDSGISSQSSIVGSGTKDLCSKCGVQPINGAFIHGNSGHQVYCYSCSKRELGLSTRCPICSQRAKVIRIFDRS